MMCIGKASINSGGTLEYEPVKWYFGADSLLIQMDEVNLPPGYTPNSVQVMICIFML